jgi:hypothetical protein
VQCPFRSAVTVVLSPHYGKASRVFVGAVDTACDPVRILKWLSGIISGGSRKSLRPRPPLVTVATTPSVAVLECIVKPEHRRCAPGRGLGCQGPGSAPDIMYRRQPLA